MRQPLAIEASQAKTKFPAGDEPPAYWISAAMIAVYSWGHVQAHIAGQQGGTIPPLPDDAKPQGAAGEWVLDASGQHWEFHHVSGRVLFSLHVATIERFDWPDVCALVADRAPAAVPPLPDDAKPADGRPERVRAT
jgi:hypothetical protein